MKMQKRTSVGGAFARKEPYEYEGTKYDADIKDGDMVKILNKGDVVVGEYGEQYVFSIETRNGEKNANFNQSSINVLVDEFGEESEEWVGKEVKVLTKKGTFGGKKGIAAYFVTPLWELDDYGELSKKVEAGTDGTGVEYPDAEIGPDDIPFE